MGQIAKTLKVERDIIAAIEPVVSRLGYELWDVVWIPRQQVLRLFISRLDAELAITHDDCQYVSKQTEDMIGDVVGDTEMYQLEVSSLGPKPQVRTTKQLARFKNEVLEFVDRNGKKFAARIADVGGDGRIEWGIEERPNACCRSYGDISEFQRIRVKKARF